MSDEETVGAIYDPGEVDRDTHNPADRIVVAIGNLLSWLFPILMLVIVLQVLFRNFGRIDLGPGNQAWMDDLQWWLYGVACLVGVAYAVTTNSHVRVDIFYDNYPEAKRRRVDLFALGWLFLPFTLVTWDVTLHYAIGSVIANEGSDSPNGLHNLWLLKIAMNACFLFLGLAILARVVRLLQRTGEDSLWARFFWTLPGTAFAINLVLFYAMWWLTRITDPEMNPRSIARNGILMAEVEYGPYETKLTVIVSLVITAAIGVVLYARRTR